MSAVFRVARNPDAASRLPYLLWLPLDDGLVLKAREPWPRAARVFCAQDSTPWDKTCVVVDEAAVLLCRRRGAAIDLVLDHAQLARSQFVFTQARGRPVVWWQPRRPCRQRIPALAFPGALARTPHHRHRP